MRITKIGVHLFDSDRVGCALQAAFRPFSSLTEGVDGSALAEAMILWVNAKRDEQPGLAMKLIGLVWGTTTEQISTVEVWGWEVALRTPTSGTKIRLRRYMCSHYVEVDFGTEGSESRALTILAAAERSGIRFDAYAGEERILPNYN